jgi:hypothetical protein
VQATSVAGVGNRQVPELGAEQAAALLPFVATVVVACTPNALTGALRDIVTDASLIRDALDCSLPVAAPVGSIGATAVWELAVATVDGAGLKLGVAYGAHDLPDAMHRAGRAASALITVLSDQGIVAADSGTVSVTQVGAT